jgi:hypothetical protein
MLWKSNLWAALLLGLILTVGCSGAGNVPTEEHSDDDHADGEHSEGDHEDEESDEMIPNDGAVIRIVSPEDGTTISDQIEIKIEVENFDLSEGHWHIQVDDEEWGMIENGDTSYVLRGLGAGTHTITVLLSTETHQTLEDGDSITLIVE